MGNEGTSCAMWSPLAWISAYRAFPRAIQGAAGPYRRLAIGRHNVVNNSLLHEATVIRVLCLLRIPLIGRIEGRGEGTVS